MAQSTRAIQAVVDHVAAASTTSKARRDYQSWATGEADLTGYATPADLADAIREARPREQDRLLTCLLRAAADDELAQLVAVAGLSRRLESVLAKWRRAGLRAPDLDQMEADLVAECWVAVAATAKRLTKGDDPPPAPGLALIQPAWEAVRYPRRLDRAHTARYHVTAAPELQTLPDPPREHPVTELAAAVIEAHNDGHLTRTGAMLILATRCAGLSVVETAARFGCSPQSVSTRRARAEARLVRDEKRPGDDEANRLPAAA